MRLLYLSLAWNSVIAPLAYKPQTTAYNPSILAASFLHYIYVNIHQNFHAYTVFVEDKLVLLKRTDTQYSEGRNFTPRGNCYLH